MKSAVEIIIECLKQNQYFIGNDLYETLKKAKEIEELLIMKSYNDGCIDTLKDEMKKGEDYYKEQFKNK